MPSSARWVPSGADVTVAGFQIRGGMIYMGTGLQAVGHYGGVEPALIDPTLPVDRRNPDRACAQMQYWPSYSTIPPGARAAYLEWLASGRRDPGFGVGHVFLYFYGLERRALYDAQSDENAYAEIPAIIQEVEQLLAAYGTQGSFHSYATSFLAVLKGLGVGKVSSSDPPPAEITPGYEFPLNVRLGLGVLALEGKPTPPEWALAWYRSAPMTRLRTPAQRCPEELAALFSARYRARFGDGLVVKAPKKTIDMSYRPASASFAGSLRLSFSDQRLAAGVPDVTSLQGPLNKITEVAESCVTDLEPYSRWVGRNPSLRSSPAAFALLPPELVVTPTSGSVADLWSSIGSRLEGETFAVLPGGDLLEGWNASQAGRLTRSDLILLAQLLEKRGYGVEPDVRFGGPALAVEKPCVVFRLPPGSPSAPSARYAAAAILLQLSVTVAAADEEVSRHEAQLLEEHLGSALAVTPEEQARLRAHMQWLLAERPAITGLKKRLDALDRPQREAIGRFLVGVAAADGRVTPSEITTLTKLYRLLDLDPQSVYSEVHSQTSAPSPAAEPVTVRPPSASRPGYGIPAPPQQPTTQAIALDMARVEQKLQQTATVSALLQSIFIEEEPAAASRAIEPSGAAVAGLDGPHSAFLRTLAAKSSWTRTDLESLAADAGVLPDGALDAVNEAALNLCGECLCEGDDPIEINPDVLKELAL